MKSNKRIKRLAIATAALTAFALVGCNEETPEASSPETSVPEVRALTQTEWTAAFTQLEGLERLAAEVTYAYNIPSDDLTTAFIVKMDGNVRYQKEVMGNNKYVYEGYSVYDDTTMTMVNYRLDGANSTWKKRTNTYTESNYESAKKNGSVLHSIGLYYCEYSLSETDTTKYALADLFSSFTYDKGENSYSATLYRICEYDEEDNPVYGATKFTCKFEEEKLVELSNEYEWEGVKSVSTIKLTAGESLSVPASIVEGATEASGGKK